MKQILPCFLLILCLFAGGCTPAEEVRIYRYDSSAEEYHPLLMLMEDGTFQFLFHPTSSYIATGSYTFRGDQLILTSSDRIHQYIFFETEEGLRFDAAASSGLPSYAVIPDGAPFRPQTE